MKIPDKLQYTKDHEWISIENGVATVGITEFAQGELGDIVYVEVETLDEQLQISEVFGTVEAVKTVSDLFMPLSGTIIEFNNTLSFVKEKEFLIWFFIKNKNTIKNKVIINLKLLVKLSTIKLLLKTKKKELFFKFNIKNNK